MYKENIFDSNNDKTNTTMSSSHIKNDIDKEEYDNNSASDDQHDEEIQDGNDNSNSISYNEHDE